MVLKECEEQHMLAFDIIPRLTGYTSFAVTFIHVFDVSVGHLSDTFPHLQMAFT